MRNYADAEGARMRYRFATLPLMLALVLGRQLEEQLRVSLVSSQGDISIFFTSPISLGFLGLAAVSVIWSLAAERRRHRAAALVSGGDS